MVVELAVESWSFEMGAKRVSPNFWVRIKSGRRAGYAAAGVTFTVATAVITAISGTQSRVPWKLIIFFLVLTVAVFPIVAYWRGRLHLIPDFFVDELSEDGQYSCEFCSEDRLREACKMTEAYYGHDYVAADIALQWWMKNPKAFVAIVNSDGVLCACFGILALKDSFMDQFIAGKVSDKQLSECDIHNFSASKRSKRLYISGVIVRNPRTPRGGKRTRVMIWVMLKYVRKVYGAKIGRQLFALAVTKDSESLMKRFDFQLVGLAAQREDKHNLYSYDLTEESRKKMLQRVYDCSRMCKCEF
jgi:hypothetical protein